jgi:hypothetical protein
MSIRTQAVNGYDARMLQTSGHFTFDQEAGTRVRIVLALRPDRLEGHFAIKFRIQGHGNLSQPTLSVRPQEVEPAALESSFAGLGRIAGAGLQQGLQAWQLLHIVMQAGRLACAAAAGDI